MKISGRYQKSYGPNGEILEFKEYKGPNGELNKIDYNTILDGKPVDVKIDFSKEER